LIELNEDGDQFVIHREVTWNWAGMVTAGLKHDAVEAHAWQGSGWAARVVMKEGERLRLKKIVRSQKTGMFLPKEGTLVYITENLGRRLLLVAFDDGNSEYLFDDEIERRVWSSVLAMSVRTRKPVAKSFSSTTAEVMIADPSDRETINSVYQGVTLEREQALMAAILETAVKEFQRYFVARDQKEKRHYQEAVDWIMGKNSDWLFSFENVCEDLGLNPSYLRRRLRAWAEGDGDTAAHSRDDKFPGRKLLKRRSFR
jgi:hypothetical protein